MGYLFDGDLGLFEGVAIMNTSIIELVCLPLRLTGTPKIREAYVYEHVYTGIIVSLCLTFVPSTTFKLLGFGFLVGSHLIAKEFIVDVIKHGSINWPNVWERVFGLTLGALVLWIK